MATITIAALQMRSGVDPQRNGADFEELVREAAAKGAVYVQSPEMTGLMVRDKAALQARVKPEAEDLLARTASSLAAELGIHLHVGSTAIARDDGRFANRALLFGPDGSRLAAYDKIHMFDVDLDNGENWRESATYEPGTIATVADLPWGRLGMAVCYDVRFPHLFRAQAMAGAQILTAPAAFTRQTGQAHWHVLQRARAIENGAFMISAAQGGLHEDGRETFGHSLVVDPWGEVVAEASHDEPCVIVADIDLTVSAAARAKIPNLKNGRDFAVEHAGGAAAHRKAS